MHQLHFHNQDGLYLNCNWLNEYRGCESFILWVIDNLKNKNGLNPTHWGSKWKDLMKKLERRVWGQIFYSLAVRAYQYMAVQSIIVILF